MKHPLKISDEERYGLKIGTFFLGLCTLVIILNTTTNFGGLSFFTKDHLSLVGLLFFCIGTFSLYGNTKQIFIANKFIQKWVFVGAELVMIAGSFWLTAFITYTTGTINAKPGGLFYLSDKQTLLFTCISFLFGLILFVYAVVYLVRQWRSFKT